MAGGAEVECPSVLLPRTTEDDESVLTASGGVDVRNEANP